MAVVFFARLQIRVRDFPSRSLSGELCWRIRELLALEADAYVLWIFYAMLACNACSLEVSGVHLYARLIGIDLKEYASYRRVEACGNSLVVALAILECVENPVVVVACGVLYLVVREIVDVVGQWVRLAEVHRCALDRPNLACWNVQAVGRSELVGIDVSHHVVARFRQIAVEIEVRVVGHVDDGLLVGCSFEHDVEGVVSLDGVRCSGFHGAAEAVVAVGLCDSEDNRRVGLRLNVVDLVHPSGVATAVKTVAVVVRTQVVGLAFDRQLGVLYAVGIATY